MWVSVVWLKAFVSDLSEYVQGGGTCTSGPATRPRREVRRQFGLSEGSFTILKQKTNSTPSIQSTGGPPCIRGYFWGSPTPCHLPCWGIWAIAGRQSPPVPSALPKPLSHLDVSRTLGKCREEATEQGLVLGMAWPGAGVGGAVLFTSSCALGLPAGPSKSRTKVTCRTAAPVLSPRPLLAHPASRLRRPFGGEAWPLALVRGTGVQGGGWWEKPSPTSPSS